MVKAEGRSRKDDPTDYREVGRSAVEGGAEERRHVCDPHHGRRPDGVGAPEPGHAPRLQVLGDCESENEAGEKVFRDFFSFLFLVREMGKVANQSDLPC